MTIVKRTGSAARRLRGGRASACLVVLALVAACGGTDDTPSGTAEGDDDAQTVADGDPDIVRVGGTLGSSDVAFFIAEAEGYFEEENIEMDLLQFTSASDMIAPLGSGEIDVAGGAPSAGLLNSIGRDIDLRIVADKGSNVPGQGYFSLVVRSDLVESGEFSGFEDLQGRTIAFTGAGNTTQALVDRALDSVGIDYDDADITEELLGFGEQVTALDNGSVEVGTIIEPFATAAEDLGAGVRFPGDEFYPDQQVAVVMYGEDFIQRDEDLAQRFMNAYVRGARFYNDAIADGTLTGPNAERVIEILLEYTAVEDEDVYIRSGPAGLHPDGAVNVDGLRSDLDFWTELGLIQGDVDLSEVVDTSFAERAVDALGPYESAD